MINSCTKPFKLMIFNINPILKIYFLCDADNSGISTVTIPNYASQVCIEHQCYDIYILYLFKSSSRTVLSILLQRVSYFMVHRTPTKTASWKVLQKKSSNKLRMKALEGWNIFYQHSKLIYCDIFLTRIKIDISR